MENRYQRALQAPPAAGGVEYDVDGKPYIDIQGRRSYLSPMAMGQQQPGSEQGGGLWRSREQWNQDTGQWERPINWGNVTALGVGTGLTYGMTNALTAPSVTAPVGGVGPAADLLNPALSMTAATVPPAVVPPVTGAAGSRIASWLAPAANAAGTLGGAAIQARSNRQAAELQRESTREALGFERQQYHDLLGRLAPYIASGQSANARMAALLGLSAPGQGPPPETLGRPAPDVSSAQAGVVMRAPDGSMKRVPQAQVAHYQAKGATLVGGRT